MKVVAASAVGLTSLLSGCFVVSALINHSDDGATFPAGTQAARITAEQSPLTNDAPPQPGQSAMSQVTSPSDVRVPVFHGADGELSEIAAEHGIVANGSSVTIGVVTLSTPDLSLKQEGLIPDVQNVPVSDLLQERAEHVRENGLSSKERNSVFVANVTADAPEDELNEIFETKSDVTPSDLERTYPAIVSIHAPKGSECILIEAHKLDDGSKWFTQEACRGGQESVVSIPGS